MCNQARTFIRRPTRMLPNVSCPCVGSWARTLLPAATAGALSRIAARVTRREAAKRRFILRNATEFDRIERNDVKMRTCKQPKEFVSSLCGLGNKKKMAFRRSMLHEKAVMRQSCGSHAAVMRHWHFDGQCCMQTTSSLGCSRRGCEPPAKSRRRSFGQSNESHSTMCHFLLFSLLIDATCPGPWSMRAACPIPQRWR